MESSMSMPGSFLTDHDTPPRPTLTRTSATSGFLPPQSPSAAPSFSSSIQPKPRIFRSASNTSRKRQRVDITSSYSPSPVVQYEDEDGTSPCLTLASPAPLVNTSYRLAGGLDTPSARCTEEDIDEEQNYRRNCFARQAWTAEPGEYFPQTPSLLQRDGNGRKRAPSTPSRPGWGRIVLSIPLGIAGKVYQFCTNAFQGFSAGGGQAYQLGAETPSFLESSSWVEFEEKHDVFNREYKGSTPLPGQFPPEAFIDDYMSHPQSYQEVSATPTPLSSVGADSTLRSNWIVVESPRTKSRETSPLRKRSRFGEEARRPLSRGLVSTRPRLNHSTSSATSASYASPRGGYSRPSSSESRSNTSPVRQSHHRSRPSIASPRGSHLPPPQDSGDRPKTPVSPEVKQFQKRANRLDKKNAESLRRLTRQTEDLLRMGREALGTSFEIQEGGAHDTLEEDEGYGPSEGSIDDWR